MKGNDVQPGHQAGFFLGGFRDLPSLKAGAGNFTTNPKNTRRAGGKVDPMSQWL